MLKVIWEAKTKTLVMIDGQGNKRVGKRKKDEILVPNDVTYYSILAVIEQLLRCAPDSEITLPGGDVVNTFDIEPSKLKQ